jgi:hypothetical protein
MPMTAEEARALTDRAKQHVDQASALAEASVAIVEKVISSGGHTALGYSSPGQYLHAEFDVSSLQFTPDERREMALMLVRNGVSKRGAARALGVDDKTVRTDLSNADQSALPDRIETRDGRSFPLTRPVSAAEGNVGDETGTDEVVDADIVNEPDLPTDEDLLNGREWTQPDGPGFQDAVTPPVAAPKAKRRPLPEALTEASRDYVRAAERLARLTEDDRFPKNRDTTQLPELLGALDTTARFVQALRLDQTAASEEARRWWATSLHKISDALADVANSIEQEQ